MTLIRQLKGFVNGDYLKKKSILVAFTADRGETISVKYGQTMFTMPYKPIEQMVERERDKNYKDGHFIIDETDEYIPVEWLGMYQNKARDILNGQYRADQVIQWVIDDWNKYCQNRNEEGKENEEEKQNN